MFDVAAVPRPKFVRPFACCVPFRPWLLISTLSLLPNDVVTVVAKFGSSPRATANSLSVFSESGAVSTNSATAVSTYPVVAYPLGLVAAYAPISARDQLTLALPLKFLPVLPIVKVRAV